MEKIAALSQILEQNPTDSFARYGLAMEYASAGKTEQALAEYATILKHAPEYVPAYQMSAQLLLKTGQTDQARRHLTDGIRVAGETGNAHAASEMQAMLDDLTS